MKKIIVTLFCLFFLSVNLTAKDVDFSLNTNLSKITGHTLYNISFITGYEWPYGQIEGESELEFDIDAVMLTISAELAILDQFLVFHLSYGETVSTEGGNFRDRDWIHTDYSSELYGDTDSDIESDGEIFDFKVKCNLFSFGNEKFIKLFANAGFQNQSWGTFATQNYEGRYGNEYYSEQYDYDILTYKVDYSILYSGVGVDINLNNKVNFTASLDIGVVDAEDDDNHVLRDKISKGDATGVYSSLYSAAKLFINENIMIYADLKIVAIETEGDQTQSFYENGRLVNRYDDIDNEINSEQTSFGIGCKILFS